MEHSVMIMVTRLKQMTAALFYQHIVYIKNITDIEKKIAMGKGDIKIGMKYSKKSKFTHTGDNNFYWDYRNCKFLHWPMIHYAYWRFW